jgi:hypothetical protein
MSCLCGCDCEAVQMVPCHPPARTEHLTSSNLTHAVRHHRHKPRASSPRCWATWVMATST